MEEGSEYFSSFGGILYNKDLTEIVAVPHGIKGEVVLADTLTSIGNYAFYKCSGLTSVTMLEGVTSIGNSVFSGCSSLTNIIIPEGVTSIGGWAFNYCSALTTVYYTGTAEEWDKITIGSNNEKLTAATVCYYSANDPFAGENAATDGNYWRYVNGEPVVWVKEDEQAAA